MADDLLTIADVIYDALNLSDKQVSDLRQRANFIMSLPTEESSDGTAHRYTKEVGAPSVGWRQVNQGRDHDHSEDIEVVATLEILDYSWKVDKALADRRRGRKGGREAFIAREGLRHLKKSMFSYEQQVLKGQVGADATGIEGIADQSAVASLAGGKVINAGGSTANGCSSVYAISIGDNDVTGVYNGDTPFELGDTVVQEVQDASGKSFPAYYTPGCTWLGMQVGSAHSFARIANLDLQVDSGGKYINGINDDMIAKLVTELDSQSGNVVLVMSRYARHMLQQSRTATTATGTPAPLPDESHGYEIIVSEALTFDEAVLT